MAERCRARAIGDVVGVAQKGVVPFYRASAWVECDKWNCPLIGQVFTNSGFTRSRALGDAQRLAAQALQEARDAGCASVKK